MKYVLHANIVILFNATQKFYTEIGSTGLTKFVWPVQKSRLNLSLPKNFQFGNRRRTFSLDHAVQIVRSVRFSHLTKICAAPKQDDGACEVW